MVVLSTFVFTEDKIRIRQTYHSPFYAIGSENSVILYVYVFKKAPYVFPK